MTFEQALNNRPTAYNFSREKWNKVSDVDALVASLKEAHEQEIAMAYAKSALETYSWAKVEIAPIDEPLYKFAVTIKRK